MAFARACVFAVFNYMINLYTQRKGWEHSYTSYYNYNRNVHSDYFFAIITGKVPAAHDPSNYILVFAGGSTIVHMTVDIQVGTVHMTVYIQARAGAY